MNRHQLLNELTEFKAQIEKSRKPEVLGWLGLVLAAVAPFIAGDFHQGLRLPAEFWEIGSGVLLVIGCYGLGYDLVRGAILLHRKPVTPKQVVDRLLKEMEEEQVATTASDAIQRSPRMEEPQL